MKKVYKVRNDEGRVTEVDEDRLAEAERDGYYPLVESIDGDIKRVESKNFSLAEKDGYRPVFRFEEPEISQTESALRGAAQGASFGFADEIEARLKSLLGDKTYEEIIPEIRQRYDKAAEQNPYSYYGAEIAGGLAVPVPGTTLLTAPLKAKKIAGAAKSASLSNAALEGAVGGALYGAGSSTGADAAEVAKDVATGAVVGGVAAPVITKGLEAAKQGASKIFDMSIFGRTLKDSFNLAKDTTKKYLDEVENVVSKLKAEGKSPEEIQKEIDKIPDPFGSVKSYVKDQDLLKNKARDIVEELTSPEGAGPLGMVNRKYKQAEALMAADKIGLELNEITSLLDQTVSDEASKSIVKKLIGKVAGSSRTMQTPEELANLAVSKLSKEMRTQLFNKKNELKKEAIEEAKKVFAKAGNDIDSVYIPHLEATFERDKRRYLNKLYNELKKTEDSSTPDIMKKLQEAEDMLDSSFKIERIQDKGTGNAVYQYTAKTDADVLQGIIPTKTKYEKFGTLTPEEKRKAILEYANDSLKLKEEAIQEIIKGLKVSVNKIDDTAVEAVADVPLSADVFLPNKRIELPLKEIVKYNKDKLNFSDIQRLKGELSDVIESAIESGNIPIKEDLINLRSLLDMKLNEVIERESPQALGALKEANKFRKDIVKNDINLLLNSPRFNPLSNAVNTAKREYELRKLTNKVESLLMEEPSALASSRKTDLKDAIADVQKLIDEGVPEAQILMDKLNSALEIANKVYLGRQIYETRTLPDANRISRAFMPLSSAFAKSAALAGEYSSRIARNKAAQFLTVNPETYAALSEKVKNPILKKYLKTMAESDAPKRKALLFTILQNNAFKQELKDEAGIDFEEEN
jgi:hypothetical protein